MGKVDSSHIPFLLSQDDRLALLSEALLSVKTGGSDGKSRLQSLLVAQQPAVAMGSGVDLLECSGDARRWQIAKKRFEAVIGFVRDGSIISDIQRHADMAGVHISTFYRWIHQYEKGSVCIADFSDRPRRILRQRLPPVTEKIIEDAIGVYKSDKRPSVASTWRKIRKECRKNGVEVPHVNTVRYRILKLSKEEVERGRFGRRAAIVKYSPHAKGFPSIAGPLALVQIDHTPLDLIFLDEESREPIGRVYITVVFDTYSRVVLGFYLALDEPGSLSVGLALLHAILPKKPWLDELGIDVEWPFYGIPKCIYTDSAMEFYGRMLKLWAENYGCDLQLRPLKVPEAGGHIERFMRTLSSVVHELPGTTFSNPQKRGDYVSADCACMTMREFEGWLARWICCYHASPHSGLDGKSPSGKWREWFLRDEAVNLTDLPNYLPDPIQLRMSLLPLEERTIQQYGVKLFGDTYYHDVLRRYVHSSDPKDLRRQKKYTFRYDPREISKIYFLDPGTNQYFQIPWRNPSKRPCSIWEQRHRMQKIKAANRADIDDFAIDEHYDDLERREEEAKAKTQAERRKRAKKRIHASDNVHRALQKEVRAEGSAPITAARKRPGDFVHTGPAWAEINPYTEIE